MPDENKFTLQRLTASIARIIVRLWPEETQAWGRAFAAELHEIETPLASLRWLIGGLMLLTRERFRHFLKSLARPIGVPAPNASAAFSNNSGSAPRLPRLFTALVLTVSIAFLCFPEVRASLASVINSHNRKRWNLQQWNSFRKLHKEAQTNRDPQLLAFLSLLSQEPDERMRLADEAIKKDPSLTWIDYAGSYWHYADAERSHFLSDDRIARLQEFDPQNTVPLLLAAEAISHPIKQAYWARTNGRGTALGEAPEWQREITKNTAWLATMERAFATIKFDNYAAHQFNLLRVVSNRFRLSDPDVASLFLFSHRLIDYEDINIYSDLLLERGDQAARHGDTALAAANFDKVERFAECMRQGSSLSGDRFTSGLASFQGTKASKKLKSLFEATGQPAQVQLAQLATWQDLEAQLRARPHPWFERHWTQSERAGLLINLAVLLISFFFPIALLALLSLGFAASFTRRIPGRLYRLVCLAADATPVLLACSFALLFFTYHPYARAYKSYLTSTGQVPANPEDIVIAAGVTHMLPWSAQTTLNENLDAYHFWFALTALLSVLGLFLLYRMLPRRRTA